MIESKEYKEKAEGRLKKLGIDLAVNFDGIGKITGSTDKVGDHNVHVLNFIHRSGSGVLYTVCETFEKVAKDDFGKNYLKNKVAKVVFNINLGDKFTHEYIVANNECVVNIGAPLNCTNVTDATKSAAIIEDQLTPSDNIPLTFLREKKAMTEHADYKKMMDRAVKLGIAYEIDFEHLAGLPGKSPQYMNKDQELPASTAYLQYVWRSGSGIARDALDVLENLMKDDLAKTAFKAKFDKVVTVVGPGHEKIETKLVVDGKTLKFETKCTLPCTLALNTKNLITELTKML